MKISKLKKMTLAALLLILGHNGVAEAQKVSVAGRVLDAANGETLPFANVALMRTADTVFVRGASAGMDGVFRIADADTGSYLLVASVVGYVGVMEPLHLSANMEGYDIRLVRGTTLQEVEVVAEKPLYAMDGEKNMYNTKEDPSIQNGTASDALQNAPGVEVDAEGNITLRGVSSVEIWINDRPSHMQAEALKQYIKTMPAGAIERIEVITNPSARYSTSGGVINIVTNQKVTRNELLCVGVRANTQPNVSPWVSYVYANEKFDMNLYLNASYGQHRGGADRTNVLFDDNGDTSRFQNYSTNSHVRSVGGYSGLNLNWNIDEKTNLVSWVGAYPHWNRREGETKFNYLEYNPTVQDLGYDYTLRGNGSLSWGGYAGAWLEHRFDTTGRKISVSLNGNTWNGGEAYDEDYTYHNTTLGNLQRRSGSSNRSPNMGIEVNYAHPLKNNWELEAGTESNYSNSRSEETLDIADAAGNYQSVYYRSYEGKDRSSDVQAYATVQKRWGGLTVKAGLRGGVEWIHGSYNYLGASSATTFDTSVLAVVPSIHISYQSPTLTSYSLSYTRRESAAEAVQLAPFVRYDDYSYSTGNPALRMFCYTHNVEAAWNKYFMGFGMVSLNAYLRANTDEVGAMTFVGYAPAYFPSTQLVNYTMPVNIGSSHTEGLEANITYRPTAMLNVRLNASVFNYAYNYEGFRDHKWSWSARVNVWTKLWNKVEVFANAHYSSPRLGLYSLTVANKGIDLGLSSDFFDRQLSVYVNVNDIFGMAQWGSNTTAPQYQTTGSEHYDSRFVSLGLTWRIGKMELESKARQGATDTGSPQGM